MQKAADHRKAAFSASCTSHIVQDGLSSAINVLLPILAQTFGLSYTQVGLLRGVKSLVQAVVEASSGWLAERTGEAQMLIIGLVMSGLGYVGLAAAPDILVIAICFAIVGAGTGLHHAPSSALIALTYRDQGRSGALGLYNASGDVGKLAFTAGVSLATGAGMAWQGVSLIYGLIAVGAGIATLIATRRLRAFQNGDDSAEAADGEVKGWGILNWRAFATLLGITSLDTIVQNAVLLFIAFLMLAKGLPLYLATAATVIVLAGGVFGKAGCGFLAERLGVRRAFVLIQILTAAGLIAVVASPVWLAFVLLAPLGAVTQGSSSITYGFAADLIHPARMARGYALLYASGAFAAAGGPFLFGLIADGLGIEKAFYFMAGAALLAAPPIFLLPTKPS